MVVLPVKSYVEDFGFLRQIHTVFAGQLVYQILDSSYRTSKRVQIFM